MPVTNTVKQLFPASVALVAAAGAAARLAAERCKTAVKQLFPASRALVAATGAAAGAAEKASKQL